MLRLLNHSKGLKVGKWIASEKKKPSDKQPSRQTNYTKHQTEDKCTARFATKNNHPQHRNVSLYFRGETAGGDAAQLCSARHHWSLSCICCCILFSISCILFNCRQRGMMSWMSELISITWCDQSCQSKNRKQSVCFFADTSSSFILMSFSVSTSGVESGRMGMGLSIRLSWASLLKRRSRSGERGEMMQPCYFFKLKSANITSELLFIWRFHKPGHLLYAVCSVIFIVDIAGHVFEIVHVRSNQHVPQFHEVTMRLVLHWWKE